MRFKVRQIFTGGVILAVSLSVVLVFQNCGTPKPLNTSSLSSTSDECLDNSMCADMSEYLALTIENQSPIPLKTADAGFDVGGYCDAARFTQSNLYYEMRLTSNGSVVIARTKALMGCDALGRFRIFVPKPGTFQPNQQYELEVELVGLDDEGFEVQNPIGISKQKITVNTSA